MKFTITMNQQILSKTDLDVMDGAILDYIYFFCNSPSEKIKEKRIIEEKEVWSWIDHKTLLKDMPMLKIKSTGALTPRINKIEKAGFIRTKHFQNRKKYYQMTAKSDELFIYMNKTVHTDEQYCSYKRTNKDKRIKKKNNFVGKADEQLNSTVNQIMNSMNSSSGQQNKKTEIFNYEEYLDSMKNNKNRNIQIIRIFFLVKQNNYTNLEQVKAAIDRNLRAAKLLVGYSDERIKSTMEWLDGKFPGGEYRWKLETVSKYIDDIKKIDQVRTERIYV